MKHAVSRENIVQCMREIQYTSASGVDKRVRENSLLIYIELRNKDEDNCAISADTKGESIPLTAYPFPSEKYIQS